MLQGVDGKFEQHDHVVTVAIGARRVWDPSKTLIMSLMRSVFDECVGDGFDYIKICELKTLEKQEICKRKRKNILRRR